MTDHQLPGPVIELIEQVTDDAVRNDAYELALMMSQSTGETPEVWSSSTIGYGRYHYRYGSGQEGDFFNVGFAPRRRHLTLYIMSGLGGFDDILERLGPHEASKSTVHIKKLADIDLEVLDELVRECVTHVKAVERDLGAIPRMSDIPPREPRS